MKEWTHVYALPIVGINQRGNSDTVIQIAWQELNFNDCSMLYRAMIYHTATPFMELYDNLSATLLGTVLMRHMRIEHPRGNKICVSDVVTTYNGIQSVLVSCEDLIKYVLTGRYEYMRQLVVDRLTDIHDDLRQDDGALRSEITHKVVSQIKSKIDSLPKVGLYVKIGTMPKARSVKFSRTLPSIVHMSSECELMPLAPRMMIEFRGTRRFTDYVSNMDIFKLPGYPGELFIRYEDAVLAIGDDNIILTEEQRQLISTPAHSDIDIKRRRNQ